MTKDRPKEIAASVRQRLLNISRKQKEDFQLVLIRYALERLLFRLSQSDHRDQFVLKGAMLFQIWSEETHRPTRDIDFLSRGEPSEKRFKQIFSQLCQTEVENDGLVFESDSIIVETMKDEEKYQGIRIKLDAFLASARIPIQVDVGFGDAITPAPIEIDYPTILEFEAPRISVYPRETVIAEKYQAMVRLGIANSRMKDFFDIWVLSRHYEFDGPVLRQAIEATFTRRETELPTTPPLAFSSEFANDRQKQTQWNAFVRKGALNVDGLSFGDIVNEIREFLMPPTLAIAGSNEFYLHWRIGAPWSSTG